ncbi:unnamed protein product [marine sediment metagenome]|uniref:Uncharacterized protein n=1 Tax=marine sediment metagenome TaxID=412755 RepID=X1E347_9ZZZZ
MIICCAYVEFKLGHNELNEYKIKIGIHNSEEEALGDLIVDLRDEYPGLIILNFQVITQDTTDLKMAIVNKLLVE